jgi:Tol biopolymer transport system component
MDILYRRERNSQSNQPKTRQPSNIMKCILLSFVLFSITTAQIKIVSVEALPLDSLHQWSHPRFSPDGQKILFTTVDLDGIWQYSPQKKQTEQITDSPKSGAAFSVSSDGGQIAFRRTAVRNRRRTQELVLQDLGSRNSTVIASGPELSAPTFDQSRVVYSKGKGTFNLTKRPAPARVSVLGIENAKIVLNRAGRKVLFDPLGNGHYTWPAISPDGTRIVAYDMDRGAFVCNLDGTNLSFLGRCDSPTWTRDGKWIVFMDDRDDGNRLLSSDIAAVSPDGKKIVRLTTTDDILELNPQCSPAENKIVCESYDGRIYVLSYVLEGK